MAELAEIVKMTPELADAEVARRVRLARQRQGNGLGEAAVTREGAVLAKKLTPDRRLHWMNEISTDRFDFPGLSAFFTELRALNYAEEADRQWREEERTIIETGRPR